MKTIQYLVDTTEQDKQVFFDKILSMWTCKQVTKITEESGELMTEMGLLLKLISKLQKNSPTATIDPSELLTNENFIALKDPLVDEIADYILVLDQFYKDFFRQIIDRYNFKYSYVQQLAKADKKYTLLSSKQINE